MDNKEFLQSKKKCQSFEGVEKEVTGPSGERGGKLVRADRKRGRRLSSWSQRISRQFARGYLPFGRLSCKKGYESWSSETIVRERSGYSLISGKNQNYHRFANGQLL